MKTYKNLYQSIWEFDNIHKAYIKARRLKRYTPEVLKFSAHLEENLVNIHNQLMQKTYRPGKYRHFTIHEPKKRLIAALPFSDRVIQHALCNIIEPIFERSFIYDSYACRIGKGVLAGMHRVVQFLKAAEQKWEEIYCLKMDISKYFSSINHTQLKQIIRKYIACPDTLQLIDLIIDSEGLSCGIPIGSLTSQLFANIYLNELDHFAKDQHRVKYYVRYMDDVVILHNEKNYLHELHDKIEEFLCNNLYLALNSKTQILPVKQRGIDFLGYRIWQTHILPRKRTIKRAKRRFTKFSKLYSEDKINIGRIRSSLMSFLGYIKHCNAHRTTLATLKHLTLKQSITRQ